MSSSASDSTFLPVAVTSPKSLSRYDFELNTSTVPRLRAFGFAGLIGIVSGYSFVINGGMSTIAWTFTILGVLYPLVSQILLRRFFSHNHRGESLADLLFLTDITLWVFAIYCTGGETSWLTALLILRPADLSYRGRRKAALFGYLSTLAYCILLVYLVGVEGRPLNWGLECVKVASLYAMNLYLSAVSKVVERLTKEIMASRRQIARLRRESRSERESVRRLQAASKEQIEFLAVVSHEIRTPLNGLIGMVELLGGPDLNGTQSVQYQTLARERALYLRALLNNLQDFTSPGQIDSAEDSFELRRSIEEVAGLFRGSAKEGNVEFDVIVDVSVPDFIYGDSTRLKQVLINLLSNAFKYTEKGRVELAISVDAVLASGGRTPLLFEVSDSGVGISQEHQDRIFGSFQRAPTSVHGRQPRGVGIGLTISRRIVAAFGGQLRVESEVGKGSRFSFVLLFPTDRNRRVGPDRGVADVPANLGSLVHLPVLVAEDERVSRLVLTRILETEGFEVVAVNNGSAAIMEAFSRKYAMLFLDHHMPGLTGCAVAESLRKEPGPNQRVPIFLVTAEHGPALSEMCRELGITDFLPKPIDRGSLVAAAFRAINGKRAGAVA